MNVGDRVRIDMTGLKPYCDYERVYERWHSKEGIIIEARSMPQGNVFSIDLGFGDSHLFHESWLKPVEPSPDPDIIIGG